MVKTVIKSVSLKEFLDQPETKPTQEYIDNCIYKKPMPQGKHSRIQQKLINIINNVTENNLIALALPELRCTFDNYSIVPDIAVFKWENIPVNEDGEIANQFNFTPDWVIEILSPDQYMGLVTKKILSCLNNGSFMGWLIDPQTKLIFIYTANNQPLFFENNNDIIPVPNFVDNLKITVGDIFDCLKIRKKIN
ncbi:Uma2 family endonuclease [Geminocystis sp. GBBB08]|uniref:Uma2 family endonuclease n=1 Tax=Geminocystis sp. GBBB08 TaxID=2604140 RepID=UPI0027E395D3|nr:Uma2 family endonuclease [Geminocystis sp. GBBB08]MBL1208516.1 Uma2 family endonuclease [Geminocystis sp. GBBB08]